MQTDESAPLRAIARGDQVAFASLFDSIGPETFGLCRQVSSAWATAEALHQEIWMLIWRHAASLSSTLEPSRTVVLTVARGVLTRSAARDRV